MVLSELPTTPATRLRWPMVALRFAVNGKSVAGPAWSSPSAATLHDLA